VWIRAMQGLALEKYLSLRGLEQPREYTQEGGFA
jgi:hypothetical protein